MDEAWSFPALLTTYRKRTKLSMNRLASLAGVDPAYVHRMEHGKSPRPSSHVLEQLIASLNLAEVEADTLRVAAGYCPLFITRMSPARFHLLRQFVSQS